MRADYRTYVGTHLLRRQMVYVDEGGKDERTADRRFGWSEVGKRCVVHTRAEPGTRYSILPILGLEGVLACEIIEGSYTGELFAEFIRNYVVCRVAIVIYII